jgi:antitoxin component HigA of HigAB toxin-antitoxin module
MEQDLALFVRLLRIDAEVSVVEMVNTDVTAHTLARARELEEFRAQSRGGPVEAPSQTTLRRMNTATRMNAALTER